VTLKRLGPAGTMKFWSVHCSPVPACLLSREKQARGGFWPTRFSDDGWRGRRGTVFGFGRLLRETFWRFSSPSAHRNTCCSAPLQTV